MSGALSFLQSVSGFVQSERDGSADRPCLLGVIDPAYAGLPTLPKVTFEGESTLSGKTYPHLASYVPVASDRVVLVPVGTTYLIVGPVAATAAAVALQGGSVTVAGSALDLGTWQAYTPAWTASTTSPTIGNAVVSGRYIYLNKHTVRAVIRISPGSTSAKGTGNYLFSLPVAAASSVGFGAVGSFAINDSGSALREGSCVLTSTTTVELWTNAAGGPVSAATLAGLLSASTISIDVSYEV